METVDTYLTDVELFDLEVQVCDPLDINRNLGVEAIIEMASGRKQEFAENFIHEIVEDELEKYRESNEIRVQVSDNLKDRIIEFKRALNQPIYHVVRGMVRFYLYNDYKIENLPVPEKPSALEPRGYFDHSYELRAGVDPLTQLAAEDTKKIAEDNIQGLGEEDADLCSVCERFEVYQDGICEKCHRRYGEEPEPMNFKYTSPNHRNR